MRGTQAFDGTAGLSSQEEGRVEWRAAKREDTCACRNATRYARARRVSGANVGADRAGVGLLTAFCRLGMSTSTATSGQQDDARTNTAYHSRQWQGCDWLTTANEHSQRRKAHAQCVCSWSAGWMDDTIPRDTVMVHVHVHKGLDKTRQDTAQGAEEAVQYSTTRRIGRQQGTELDARRGQNRWGSARSGRSVEASKRGHV